MASPCAGLRAVAYDAGERSLTLRSQFAKTVTALMERDERVVLCLGDIGVFAFRAAFERFPTRCYNLGICESASVDLCAGLAMGGLMPIYSTIDSFLVRRAYESIYIGFGLQRLPGVFITVGGSSDYSRLGPTHECPEAPTLMAQIPGMHIRMPVSENTVDLAITSAVRQRQLAYIRLEEAMAVRDTDNVVALPTLGADKHDILIGAQR